MNTLVLGGSQFIGLHLVRRLVEQGHRVTVLNRGVTPVEYPAGVERLRADRQDGAGVKGALAGASFDVVFDISGYTRDDVKLAMEALKGRIGHYLFCSSGVVYAPNPLLPISEEIPILRDPKGRMYSLNKVACEDYLNEASQKYGFSVTHIRPTNVYGPGNSNAAREFAYFARLEQGRRVLLPAYGLPVIPWAYVEEVAQGFLKAMGNPVAYGEAFNIASAEAVTLQGWIQLLGEVVGVTSHVVSVPPELESYVRWTPDFPPPPDNFPIEWPRSRVISIEKAKRMLGYVPCPLRRGFEETYKWYQEQPPDRWHWDFSRDEECLQKMGLGV